MRLGGRGSVSTGPGLGQQILDADRYSGDGDLDAELFSVAAVLQGLGQNRLSLSSLPAMRSSGRWQSTRSGRGVALCRAARQNPRRRWLGPTVRQHCAIRGGRRAGVGVT